MNKRRTQFVSLLGIFIAIIIVSFIIWVLSPDVIETPADISATITEIQPNSFEGFQGWITVEGVSIDRVNVETYKITINDETVLFELDGDNHRSIDFESFQIGQEVEFWFTGVFYESYPIEAIAEQVVRIP